MLSISLFAQRSHEALTVEGVDPDLYKTKFDFENNPPRKLFNQLSKEFHMDVTNVENILNFAFKDNQTDPTDRSTLRADLQAYLDHRIEHRIGTAPKSEFKMGLHLAVFHQIIDDLGKEFVYISAKKVKIELLARANINISEDEARKILRNCGYNYQALSGKPVLFTSRRQKSISRW